MGSTNISAKSSRKRNFRYQDDGDDDDDDQNSQKQIKYIEMPEDELRAAFKHRIAQVNSLENIADFLTRLDLMDNTVKFLPPNDINSLSSVSKDISEVVKGTLEVKCINETSNAMFCGTTQNISLTCKEWCEKNSIRKLHSVFNFMRNLKATFRFSDQPSGHESFRIGEDSCNRILLRIEKDSTIKWHKMFRYNNLRDRNEEDNAYGYITRDPQTNKDSERYYSFETILRKLEILVKKPFIEWGKWEIVVESGMEIPNKRQYYINIKNKITPGILYIENKKQVPCNGVVNNVHNMIIGMVHGLVDITIHIGTMSPMLGYPVLLAS